MCFEKSNTVTNILAFHCPRSHELPHIDLYIDQLIALITDILSSLHLEEDEKLLTSAMINNYVKQGIVSPSKNKKYTKNHLMYLIVVCIFKKMLSIQEICDLILIQIDTYPVEATYDYFCMELENALHSTFLNSEQPLPHVIAKETDQTKLLRRAVLAFTSKLYIQKYIIYSKTIQN